jgi:probable phosphoglycerate mutase
VQFLFIRHGQTDYNLTGRVQGQIDIPLNELGRWQAERIGERLKGYDLCGIFASDLSRAHDTARAIAQHHPNVTMLTSELLREVAYGVFEGMQLGEIEQTYPEEYLQWREGDVGYAPPEAENIYEQRARAAKAMIWVREHCTDAEGTIAVVSHGTIGRALVANLLDFGVDQQLRFHFDNTSLTVIEETPRGMSLRLANDTSHLGDRSPFP